MRVLRVMAPGKKVNGRKWFIVTDIFGLLITVLVRSASIQDRDGAKSSLVRSMLVRPSPPVRNVGLGNSPPFGLRLRTQPCL